MNDVSVVNVACIITFLGLATLSAILLKRMRFPYTIGLVVIGIVVGGLAGRFELLAPMSIYHITPNVILYVLLPALLFDAAINIDIRLLVHNLTPTLILAAPGLIVATIVTGVLMAWWSPLALGPALAFGALISSTDPVSVIALFREIGAPRRLAMLVDGESLFNDATAMVAFQIICGLITGGTISAWMISVAGVQFVLVFLGGTLVGAVLGWMMVRLINLLDNNPSVTVALSMVVAYTSFLLANYYLDVSGVMAVVGAGLVVSWYGSTRFTPEVRDYMRHFWEYAAFIANSFVFLLLGLTEFKLLQALEQYLVLIPLIIAAAIAITISRGLVIYGMMPFINKLPRVVPVNWRTQTAMFWGGLRGALPIGLALSLDESFPNRQLIIMLTLGVVLFTLLVQGTTVSSLIRWLGLNRATPAEDLARLNALAAGQRAALGVLKLRWQGVDTAIRHELENDYTNKLAATETKIQDHQQASNLERDTGKQRMFWLQLNNIELQNLRTLMEDGVIGETALRQLDRDSMRRSEDINLGLPPSDPTPIRPLEHHWGYALLMCLPKNILQHAGKKALLLLLSHKYQRLCGIVMADTKLLEILPDVATLNMMDTAETEAARRYYTDRKNAAFQQLQSISYRHPTLTLALQRGILSGAAQSAARATINYIAANGGITETAAAELGQRT